MASLRLTDVGSDWWMCHHRPDQLEDVLDEAGPVVAGQRRVVVLQHFDDGVPALACVVHHVVATHVHVELHPVHLLRQVQDVCREEHGVRNSSGAKRTCGNKL